jgi:hypothetical protein
MRRNSISANLYSAEFAEFLGLSRVGVTTEISAGGGCQEKDHIRNMFAPRKSVTNKSIYSSDSTTELNAMPISPASFGSLDWNTGIKAITVVTQDTS